VLDSKHFEGASKTALIVWEPRVTRLGLHHDWPELLRNGVVSQLPWGLSRLDRLDPSSGDKPERRVMQMLSTKARSFELWGWFDSFLYAGCGSAIGLDPPHSRRH
jgi:hypothetical protein